MDLPVSRGAIKCKSLQLAESQGPFAKATGTEGETRNRLGHYRTVQLMTGFQGSASSVISTSRVDRNIHRTGIPVLCCYLCKSHQ